VIYEIGEHVDCLDTCGKWCDATVTAIDLILGISITYTGYTSRFDETICFNSNRVQKQWRFGKPF